MSRLYILNGMAPEPVADLEAWAAWIDTADRSVAVTCIGDGITVRTSFLGLHTGAPSRIRRSCLKPWSLGGRCMGNKPAMVPGMKRRQGM